MAIMVAIRFVVQDQDFQFYHWHESNLENMCRLGLVFSATCIPLTCTKITIFLDVYKTVQITCK